MANIVFQNPDVIQKTWTWMIDLWGWGYFLIISKKILVKSNGIHHSLDETFKNFYLSFSCHFKVSLPDNPGKYGLLCPCITHVQDRYISRFVP